MDIALVEKDLDITKRALAKVKIIAPEKSYTHKIAKDFLNMAESYYKDAVHVGEDDQLFTLME
jgi:hypothetical protein